MTDRVLANESLVLEHESLPGHNAAGLPRGEGLLRAGHRVLHLGLGALRRPAYQLVRRRVVHLRELRAFGVCVYIKEVRIQCLYYISLKIYKNQ